MNTPFFPVGFWNYTQIGRHAINDLPCDCVRDWVAAGMTLAMGPRVSAASEDIRRMRDILDVAGAAGLRVIVVHEGCHWRNLTALGEDDYRRAFERALAAFGNHPALFGFYVGDEPAAEEFDDACRAQRIQREMAPHLSPFLNLYPKHPGGNEKVGCVDWEEYLDRYVALARPPLLSYDCYAQMNPDADLESAGYEGWPMYFENLWLHWLAGLRHGLDYWTTLLSTAHFYYLPPTEDRLRWQLNTALAGGARGILWFFFYQRRPHGNYRCAPIDEHWERTETFGWLSRICRSFAKWHAPVLARARLTQARHVGRGWGPWPLHKNDSSAIKLSAQGAAPLILSHFQHENGSDYLAVVNNSMRDNTQFQLEVHGDNPQLFQVMWEGEEAMAPLPEDFVVKPQPAGSGCAVTANFLAPGQMELFRVQNLPAF